MNGVVKLDKPLRQIRNGKVYSSKQNRDEQHKKGMVCNEDYRLKNKKRLKKLTKEWRIKNPDYYKKSIFRHKILNIIINGGN